MRCTHGRIRTIAGTGTGGYTGDGGPSSLAKINKAEGVAIDSKGSAYIADKTNDVIRHAKIAGIEVVSWDEVKP